MALITTNTKPPTAAANRQAKACWLRLSRAVKVGMKAEASAPPANKLNRKSGMRNAALNASYSTLVPKREVTDNTLTQTGQVAQD